MKDNTEKKLSLERIYAKDKFFFRLMVVLSTLIGVIVGITMSGSYARNYGIIGITNPI